MKTLALIIILNLSALNNLQSQSWANELDSVLLILEKKELFHGQILIAEKGNISFSKAYGNNDKNPITTTMPLPIASLSKPMTALGIMILKEQKKLGFDDKVIKYLPQVPYENVTIRHLLNQTSGIPNFLSTAIRYGDTSKVMGKSGILELIGRKKPAGGIPEEKFTYNNSNYFLLRCIIESVSEMSYNNFMIDNVWQPLKMSDTKIQSHTDPSKEVEINIDNFYDAGGGIQSTAEDLFRFGQEFKNITLISEKSVDEAFSRPLLDNGEKAQYGFGWYILETPEGKSVGHWGGGEEVKTYLEFYLSEEKALVMINVQSHIHADETYQMIRNIWEGRTFELPGAKVDYKINLKLYDEYKGSYLTPNMGLLHLSVEKDKLYLRPDPIPGKERLIPSSDTTFYFKNQNLIWQIYRDEEGKVMGFGLRGDKKNMGIKQK